MRCILSEAFSAGYSNYLTLEPHLGNAAGGVATAAEALSQVLADISGAGVATGS